MAKIGARLFLTLSISVFLLNACGTFSPKPTLDFNPSTQTPEFAPPTAMPTFTPTPASLGSADNPIVICLIVPESIPVQAEAIQSVLMHMTETLALNFSAQTY